jgi:PBP1b-binding outer membrane lipoprotein LpoB
MKSIVAVGAVTASLFFSGCASTSTSYVDPNSNKTMVTLGTMGEQDWNKLTDDVLQKLLGEFVNSGQTLPASGPGGKSIFALSLIRNDTGLQINTAEMTKRIRIALNGTGKVVTDVTAGLGGAEDPLAEEAKRRNALVTGQPLKRPDFTLSGAVLERRERDKNLRQVTYVVQLSLTTQDGLAVWEGEARVVKQGTRPGAGW